MVFVIRLRPRQIERFIFVALVLLLIGTNLFTYFLWKPDKSCVSVIDSSDSLDAELDAAAAALEDENNEYQVLNLSELSKTVEAKTEDTEDDTNLDDVLAELDAEAEQEETTTTTTTSTDSKITTGTVNLIITKIDWNVDDTKDDFGHLEKVSFTVENGLNVDLLNPSINIYVYDADDAQEIKNNYHTINLAEIHGQVKANKKEEFTDIYVWNPVTKKNIAGDSGMMGFDDVTEKKTVKIVLKDKAAGVDVTAYKYGTPKS